MRSPSFTLGVKILSVEILLPGIGGPNDEVHV
jgi:hypothetical protein